jgi:hypothetical protein
MDVTKRKSAVTKKEANGRRNEYVGFGNLRITPRVATYRNDYSLRDQAYKKHHLRDKYHIFIRTPSIKLVGMC